MPTITAIALAVAAFAGPEPVNVSLTDVREVRAVALVEAAETAFTFNNDKPGLFLSFGYALPAGLEVLGINQPESITATDSTGRDLTDIEPNFHDELEFVTEKQVFQDEAPALDFTLANPARSATRFNLDCAFSVEVFEGVEEHRFPAPAEFTALPAKFFGGESVKFKLGSMGSNATVVVRPGSAMDYFESVEIVSGGQTSENQGTMWNDEQATFMFDGPANANNAQIVFNVRVGVQTLPVVIKLEDQPLP